MRNAIGKIIGLILGLAFGGPAGAFLGFILGHLYDEREKDAVRQNRRSTAQDFSHPALTSGFERATYTIGVIVLGAKMAKVDGAVSRTEVAAFKKVFQIHETQELRVGQIFDQARQTAEGFEPYAMRLAQVFRTKPFLLEEIIVGLFIVAASDSMGILSPIEMRFLSRVASLFGLTQPDFLRLAVRAGVRLPEQPSAAPQRNPDYVALGLPENATPDQIKKTYRALIRKHHPDKLAAQGQSAELIKQATEKMKRLNAAYDSICKARGIK